MKALEHLLLSILYLGPFLLDVAIFFLVVRVLSHLFPVRPILALDRIGSAGVDAVTRSIYRLVERWAARPLAPSQKEAVALFILSVVRCILGAIVS
jgi:hypothetical protein